MGAPPKRAICVLHEAAKRWVPGHNYVTADPTRAAFVGRDRQAPLTLKALRAKD